MSSGTWADIAAYPLRCQCGHPLALPAPNSYVDCPQCATRYWATFHIEEQRVLDHCPQGHALYDHTTLNGQCTLCAFIALLAAWPQQRQVLP
jgi:hypothetical protein